MGEQKDVLIISKSKKHHNYCVAAIDCEKLSLVRIISDDEGIHYAIKSNDLIDEEGNEAQVLDKVTVNLKENDIELNYQPENILLDTDKYIINYGNQDNEDLIKILDELSNRYDYIFYDTEKKILSDDLEDIDEEDRHSLEVIKSKSVTVRVKNNEKHTLKASVRYKGKWYNDLSITDINFEQEYFDKVESSQKGYITLENVYLVLSLGENYEGNHYKLVASVIQSVFYI